MKYLFLLLYSIQVLTGNQTFSFPEDSHHFYYFLEKKLSHKDQNITIFTAELQLPTLKNVLIKSQHNHFQIFVQRISPMIQDIALYRHIEIFLCSEIRQNLIIFEKNQLISTLKFKESLLRQTTGEVKEVFKRSDVPIIYPHKQDCKSY